MRKLNKKVLGVLILGQMSVSAYAGIVEDRISEIMKEFAKYGEKYDQMNADVPTHEVNRIQVQLEEGRFLEFSNNGSIVNRGKKLSSKDREQLKQKSLEFMQVIKEKKAENNNNTVYQYMKSLMNQVSVLSSARKHGYTDKRDLRRKISENQKRIEELKETLTKISDGKLLIREGRGINTHGLEVELADLSTEKDILLRTVMGEKLLGQYEVEQGLAFEGLENLRRKEPTENPKFLSDRTYHDSKTLTQIRNESRGHEMTFTSLAH